MIPPLIQKLANEHSSTEQEYTSLLDNISEENAALLAKEAEKVRKEIYGNDVYVRGLIEVSIFAKAIAIIAAFAGEILPATATA